MILCLFKERWRGGKGDLNPGVFSMERSPSPEEAMESLCAGHSMSPLHEHLLSFIRQLHARSHLVPKL